MSCWRVRYRCRWTSSLFERSEEALDHGIVVASLTSPWTVGVPAGAAFGRQATCTGSRALPSLRLHAATVAQRLGEDGTATPPHTLDAKVSFVDQPATNRPLFGRRETPPSPSGDAPVAVSRRRFPGRRPCRTDAGRRSHCPDSGRDESRARGRGPHARAPSRTPTRRR
jgi:hypothetical protein